MLLMGATVLVRPAHARDDAPAWALLKRAGLPLDGYEQFWRRWVATHRNGELAGVVASPLEPDGIVGVRRDAVLVPADVPGDRHDHLGVDA